MRPAQKPHLPYQHPSPPRHQQHLHLSLRQSRYGPLALLSLFPPTLMASPVVRGSPAHRHRHRQRRPRRLRASRLSVHAESARDLQDAARLLRSVKRGVTVVENGVVSVHAQAGLSDRQRVPADARKWREILLTRSVSSTRRGGASNAPCKPFPAFRTRSWNRTW